MRRLLSSSQTVYDFFAGSPTPSRGSSATSKSHVCWHVRLFLQLLTGTQVAGRQTFTTFSVRRPCTSLCDLPSLISLTIFSRKCRGIRPRRTAALAKTIWPSVQKAFKNFSAIYFQKAFKNFPAISFLKFSSDLLSKFCQLFSFQNFSSDLLLKSFQNFPAISFQNFSSDLLSKFWTLRDGENLKAHCFQNFVNEN